MYSQVNLFVNIPTKETPFDLPENIFDNYQNAYENQGEDERTVCIKEALKIVYKNRKNTTSMGY